VPLLRLHADDGEDLGVYASEGDPQPGETIVAGDAELRVVARIELPDGELFERSARRCS
jgi:hypothetical protein